MIATTVTDTAVAPAPSASARRAKTMAETLIERVLSKVRIFLPSARPGVSIGRKNYMGMGCRIDPGLGGHICIGDRNKLVADVLVMAYGGRIEIGHGCSINPFTVLYGHEAGLRIGNHVLIAAHCVLVPANHIFTDPDLEIWQQGVSSKGIVVEDDVWI